MTNAPSKSGILDDIILDLKINIAAFSSGVQDAPDTEFSALLQQIFKCDNVVPEMHNTVCQLLRAYREAAARRERNELVAVL